MSIHTRYASYLLRLWQMQNDQQTIWVASIQDPATGEKRPFASVGALLQFLQAEFGECGSVDGSEWPGQIEANSKA
jgi:hypothetical protein